LESNACDTVRMIPMRTSSIFKSRWMALIWSAGIIWFAVDVAGPDNQAQNEMAQAENGMTQAIAALNTTKDK
jgi:hypothetical protein